MKHIIVNKEISNNDEIRFHIDSPNSKTTYSDVFLFSGWVFSTNGDDVKIETVTLNHKNQEARSIAREDVVSHFAKNDKSLAPPLICGFSFHLKENAEVNILCGNKVIVKISFSVVDSANETELSLLDKLNKAHYHNIPWLISEKDLSSLNNTPYQYIENNVHHLKNAYWIPIDVRENLERFINNANSFDFGPALVEGALKKGFIDIESPLYAGTNAYCKSSFYVAPFNYLRFTCNDVVFYIIQHFSFCDAIYIPKLGLFHFLSIGINKNQWYKNIARTTLSHNPKEGGFNSVIAMHSRPYHYNYDISLGLHLLNKHGLLERIPLLLLHEEKSFFRPTELITKNINEVVLNDFDFKSHLNQPGFSILAGHQITHAAKEVIYRELFDEFDSLIRKNSLINSNSNTVDNICSNISKCQVRLWFGITSQKRKLINQEEEIARTINIFSSLFDSVGVVIDGWTSPLKNSENDMKEIESDTLVAENIKALANTNNVIYHSTIGLTTAEKMVVTTHIDVFLANHSTGSMHIDRMGNCFGVTHNSNIWAAADFAHIHKNSTKISDEFIKDIESNSKGQDCVDYSVAPKVIAREIIRKYFNAVLYEHAKYK